MIVDNEIIKLFVSDAAKIMNNPYILDTDNHLSFRWPSLLEYLELGSIFSNLPAFDQNQPLFKACLATLCTNEDREVLFYIYDRLFAEHLNQITALTQIQPAFLLQAIENQRQKTSFLDLKTVLSPVLTAFEISLKEKTSDTMHDLILYLSWDRMCVSMARLFDYPSNDPKFISGITVLRDSLIDSYQHIAQQGRTNPGFYRMLEALLFYQMREENLEKLTPAEWTTLSQSFPTLKAQDELADFFYIDDALKSEKGSSELYLTLDSPNRVHARLALAGCFMDKLKAEIPNWNYTLHQKNMAYVEYKVFEEKN